MTKLTKLKLDKKNHHYLYLVSIASERIETAPAGINDLDFKALNRRWFDCRDKDKKNISVLDSLIEDPFQGAGFQKAHLKIPPSSHGSAKQSRNCSSNVRGIRIF